MIPTYYISLFLTYILLETSSTLSDSTKERIEGLFNQLTEEKYEIEATNVTSIKKADLETELDRSFVNQLIALGKFVLGTDCVLVFKKSESFQFYTYIHLCSNYPNILQYLLVKMIIYYFYLLIGDTIGMLNALL